MDTDRQGDSLNDNIPAVFAVTFGASLLANVLLGLLVPRPALLLIRRRL